MRASKKVKVKHLPHMFFLVKGPNRGQWYPYYYSPYIKAWERKDYNMVEIWSHPDDESI